MSSVHFEEGGWLEYLDWQTEDRKTLRRIDKVNRLVYYMKDGAVYIVSCRGHYDD